MVVAKVDPPSLETGVGGVVDTTAAGIVVVVAGMS